MALTLQTMWETIRGWRRVIAMVNRWVALQTAGARWEINREGNKGLIVVVVVVVVVIWGPFSF